VEKGHVVDFLVEERQGQLIEELDSFSENLHVVNLREGPQSALLNGAVRAWAVINNILSIPSCLFGIGDSATAPVARIMWKERPPILSLLQYINRDNPDSIISFLNYPNMVLLLTAPLCRGKNRFVVNVRNTMSVAAANADSKWVRSVPRLMKRLFRLADAVVAPSSGAGQDVVRITGLPDERITVIPNPVLRPDILRRAREVVDHPWLDDGSVSVILGVGKMKPQKDFQTLLRAFAGVRARRPARLILLGEGADRGPLGELARELGIEADVDFPGYVQNPFPYYRRASLFVLSSIWEGLPNVLIEAMACGCPVVSTDCPSGPDEILQGGAFGKLVPVGAVDAMSTAILETLETPLSRDRLVARARHYSYDDAIAAYEALMIGVGQPPSTGSVAGC
jgi:glycosyltransferase involved in cell wall biosynthesis